MRNQTIQKFSVALSADQVYTANFPTNSSTILKKLHSGSLLQVMADDRVQCASGRVWITTKGGAEVVLTTGQWVIIPAKARAIWLSALAECIVVITKPVRAQSSQVTETDFVMRPRQFAP